MPRVQIDAIDRQAEREAESIAWFELNGLGNPSPLPRHARERGLRTFALPTRYTYRVQSFVRVWVRVQLAIRDNLPLPRFRFNITTREDRQRQAAQRKARKALAKRLARMTGTLTIPEAAQLTGIGKRTLERARQTGRLAVVKAGARVRVPIPALRDYVAGKCK
jgi:excisionase family DNA binding protein